MARYECVLAEWQDNIYWRKVEDVRKQQGRIKEIEAAALVVDVMDQQNTEDTDQQEGVKTPPPLADLGSGSSASTPPLVLALPTGTEREALQQKLSDPEFVALWKVVCLLYAGGPASGQQMQPIGDPEVTCDECEHAASTSGSRAIFLFSNNRRIQCLPCSKNPSKPRCSLSHHHIALWKFIKEKTYLPSRILPVNHHPHIVTNSFNPEKPWTKSKGEAMVGKLDITLNDMAIIQQRKAQIHVRTTMTQLNKLQSVILSSVVLAGEEQHAWLTLFSDFEAQAISDLTLLNEVLQCQRKKKEL
ncbi:hypothetical protein E1B28_009364 [Marasmius oreades]|uniref:Uncharacterized protein n=1 Tax=Marasmius oreades TaxID=181124 RepID=A0A9P7S0D2_9AGAR|nr:uncharacterized protein E1B28_009364 [Marasmius oreades]KAG7093074.1 hypothetical protein E1B28_009364 [Marasmius oreades]